MKRALDLTLAILASPFAALLLVCCALAIRLTSPGPAIFRQARVGRDEVPFVCLKLRTMRIDTPNVPSHHVGAAAITPVGAFLRRSKLDELPQLWNIFKGEMSFVGPRPCLPSQTELIAARRARGVSHLRPGITGVSQVRGIDMSDPERLAALDATYLSNMSLVADLSLILQTATGAGRGDAAAGGGAAR
jgi:O-antigen biosynthesis protein WbqP